MNGEDYRSVVDNMRLADGTLFPIPVTLPVDVDDEVKLDGRVALRDLRNHVLAIMDVEDIYEWDRDGTARSVLGTVDVRHPLVAEMHGWGRHTYRDASRCWPCRSTTTSAAADDTPPGPRGAGSHRQEERGRFPDP